MSIRIKLNLLKNKVIRIERYKVMILLYLVFIIWNVGSFSLNSDIKFINKIFPGDPKKYIALTFDDGPHPQYTEAIINVLKENNIHATFFLVGKMCLKYPDLVRLLNDSGQEIGNHTFSHINLMELPEGIVISELDLTNDIIGNIIGKKVNLMRPPGGQINLRVKKILQKNNLDIVMWTNNPGDYKMIPYERIIDSVICQAADGGVILLHSGLYNTLTALPVIINKLKEMNYEICTVSHLNSKKNRYKNISSYIKGSGSGS